MNTCDGHAPRLRRAAAVLIGITITLQACHCRPQPGSTEPATPPPDPDGEVAVGSAPDSQWITAYVRAVTLENMPLPGMLPIITMSPNAFDPPIATGSPTDERGESYVQFKSSEKVCLRAWDPELFYFPNIFHEIMPVPGAATEILDVTMVAASALEMVLIRPDNTPAANENTGVMILHPVFGPWWPAEAHTDGNGVIRFAPIPPGMFQLKLKTASGDRLELPETLLPPGKTAQLGPLRLQ